MWQRLRPVMLAWLLLAILLIFIIVLVAIDWLADLFWFEGLGYASVFWQLILYWIIPFTAATGIIFPYVWSNLRLLTRHAQPFASLHSRWPGAMLLLAAPTPSISYRLGKWAEIFPSLVAAMIVGVGFAQGWDEFVRFVWAQPFGETEPLFGHDIAFYLFYLPFLNRIQNTVAIVSLGVTALLLIAYTRAGLVTYGRDFGVAAPAAVFRHLFANAALFLVAWASGYILDRYDLLTQASGAVFGAGFTAVHVTQWALWAAAVLTLGFAVAAYLVVASGHGRQLVKLAGGYVIAILLTLIVIPDSVQRFDVLPNELSFEEPYLQRDIDFTRKAFDLATVEVRAYDPRSALDMAEIEANHDTVNNIRLWDWQPLEQTFRQLQQIRSYYRFDNVDIDRYRLGSSERQVLLSARELSPDLPGKGITWVNRRPAIYPWLRLGDGTCGRQDARRPPGIYHRRYPARGTPLAGYHSTGDLLRGRRIRLSDREQRCARIRLSKRRRQCLY